MTKLESLQANCAKVGLYVATYSPGDGKTRYRFFNVPGNTYFGPGNGIFTALGAGEAEVFARGYVQGYHAQKSEVLSVPRISHLSDAGDLGDTDR